MTQHRATIDELSRLVPFELWIDSSGKVDWDAYYNELLAVQREGFPKNGIDEPTMVKAYALALNDKDTANRQIKQTLAALDRGTNRDIFGFPVPRIESRRWASIRESLGAAVAGAATRSSDSRYYYVIH